MPRLQKVFKKRKGKYYPRKNTINSKVSTTDYKLNAQAEHAHDSKQSCAKEKKISHLNESFSSFGDSVGILNAIMNLNILAFVFKNEVHCKMCNSGLDMQVLKGKSGLAITFVLKCFACPYRVELSSSNFHEGTQIATINTRFVYAMRSIGKGAEAGRMFCGVMNLPQPPTRFSPYGKRILNAAKLVYEDSIQNSAKEAICKTEGNKNIAVAVDGTWQKRGYTSLNGVVTVTSIDTGKVIDVDILSKYCACKNLPFHEKDCKRNYVGSSGAMEIQGASKIFQRSLSLHNARYITYLGDGDCKAFDAVKKKNIYGNEYPIEKLECIGHVMKRMGTRLRRLKAQLKGQILSDGKCLSGKNRLTEHEIDNLQSYYGSAIRRNHSSVQNMRQAIWAIFLHKLSTDEYPQHGFCPIGEDSWCGFKRLKHQALPTSLNSVNKRTGEGCNTLDALVKSVRILTVKVPNRPEERVQMLLGAEVFYELMLPGQFKMKGSNVTFQNTVFGFIVSGSTSKDAKGKEHCGFIQAADNLEHSVKKFCEIENVEIDSVKNSELDICEKHFKNTHSRDDQGR
ncbi:uncharacterized protein TNCV_119751 [Trichonephila clavipes]|nr:uncharacterized protein TNCV_119751 [Trichonephila clavipes]